MSDRDDAGDDAEAHAEDHAGDRVADGAGEAYDGGHDHEESFDRHEEHGDEGRVTSPMQAFGSSEVTTGFVVLVIGLVVTFAVPLLL